MSAASWPLLLGEKSSLMFVNICADIKDRWIWMTCGYLFVSHDQLLKLMIYLELSAMCTLDKYNIQITVYSVCLPVALRISYDITMVYTIFMQICL